MSFREKMHWVAFLGIAGAFGWYFITFPWAIIETRIAIGAVAGMLTATIAGFYIGFAQPMDGFAVSALAGEAVDIEMMPGLDALLEEAP